MATKLTIAVTLLAVAAALVVTANFAPPIHAQFDGGSLPPMADLSLVADHPPATLPRWRLTVQNNRIEAHPGIMVRIVKVRIITSDANGVEETQIWTIRNLRSGKSVTRTINPAFTIATSDGPAKVALRLHAEIIDTDPAEPIGFEHNNKAEHWAMANRRDGGWPDFTNGDAAVGVSIPPSGRLPLVGGGTTFMVRAVNEFAIPVRFEGTQGGTYDSAQLDIQVRIRLSPGLTFSSSQQPPIGTTFDPGTGIWDVGVIEQSHLTSFKSFPVAVDLTENSLGELPLEERCLTAEVIRAVPWFASHFYKRDNDITTVCLGEDPVVLLDHGEVSLFHWLDCVGVVTGECPNEDTLELMVMLDRKHNDLPGFDRTTTSNSISAAFTAVRPETVVVQVLDPGGREDGKWRTGRSLGHDSGNTKGVGVTFDYVLGSAWTKFVRAISDVSPKQRPGSFEILGGNRATFKMLNADTNPSRSPSNLSSSFREDPYPVYLVFGTLGTYKINANFGATKSGTPYSDSATYTFHVGPVAELEVLDAGSSPELSAHQQAYSIMALNNGPNVPPAIQVSLTGVPRGVEVIASEGSYTQTCSGDSCVGTWTIGELRPVDSRRASGQTKGPTLTLVAADLWADRIRASIENVEDYRICIDGDGNDVAAASESACTGGGNSWHTTEYYDYVPGNNSATIKARAGTGAGQPDAARELRVLYSAIGNILMWQRVEEVNRYRVSHYEVQRWASGWVPLTGAAPGTVYFDMAGGSNADYRVRAVNIFGVPGPWAMTGRPPDMPGNFSVTLSESGNAAVLSWTEPNSPTPITDYVIDISDNPEGDSRANDATVGGDVTTWTHTGLIPGDVKFYRVQARNRDGVGAWTAWQSVSSGPGAPGSLRAQANGPSEIVLTWSEASSRDVSVYEYEMEYSDTSASEGYEWYFLQTVLHDEGLRYVDNTVPQGTTRYYRVRARTLQGNVAGAWSNVASATTSEAGPSPPLNVAADFVVGNTENAALLTWQAPASGDASYYRIEHSTDGVTWESESARHTGTCDVGGMTKFCYTDSGLFSGTEHWYRVAGVNSSGVAGEWSAPVSHVTQGDPTEPPWEPQNLRITGVSGRQVSLAWDAPQDEGGSPVTGYEYMVEAACVHDPNYICQVIAPTRTGGTTATVTVPNVKGHYEFYVRALNVAGAGWWTQSVSQHVDPQKTWRVTLSPSSLTVPEGGENIYRVRLTSDPGKPVMVALWWDGDPDLGNTLSQQQFKWLLPSNYQNPDIYLDPDYTAAWNAGVTITVTAGEDGDSDNGTAEIANTVYYVPCADLGNPAGCVDDPEDSGVTAWLVVTEWDND